jgi:hypothetical protein
LGPAQPPTQWLPGDLSLEVSDRSIKLTIHLPSSDGV